MRIALLQYPIAWADKETNLRLAEHRIAALAGKADVAVLPEMFATGFCTDHPELAETMDGDIVRRLQAVADKTDVAIVSSFICLPDNRYPITDNQRPLNNTYRLIHGEGDFLPGLIVDIYADTAVIQAHSIGMHCHRQEIAEAIAQVVPQVDKVYYKSDDTLPHKAPIQGERVGYLIGAEKADFNGDFWAKENGLDFRIDWLRGQKTGFFIDQRDNRSLLEHYAKDKEVLNMFCYTGGFSVYALRGGAKLVHSVDVSQKAIDLVRSNVAHNFGENVPHQAFAEEAFEFMAKNQNKYDLIILDPPAFAKHRDAVKNALRGYQRLNAKGIQAIRPGGILFTFSCSQAIDKDMFRLAVFSAAAQVGRKVRILHQLHQPADHPINIYHPEGEYLKGLVLQVE